MFSQFKLSTRIIAMGVTIVVAFILLLSWIFLTVNGKMYDGKMVKTKHLAESAWTIVDNYAQQARAGKLTIEEAQQAAIATLKGMRYDQNEYFWINDMSPKMIMHPFKPELDGTDVSQMADPNGKRLFLEFVEVCRKSGGGVVEYEWPKPNVSKPVPKISYVKLQSDWGWIVGTGVYLDDVQAEMSAFFYTLFWVVLVITLGSLGLIYFMSRSITRPINDAVERLSSGAEQVGSASDLVSTASQSLAEATTEQASSLQETSSALEEMSSMTKQNADNANQANQLANIARTAADKGTHAMESMSKAIGEIKQSSDETAKIIKVIDEIAFQTNLLALNAAVEAARAGEAGKGFAVVAEEVRNLAQRSAEAAKNTNSLIEGSQKNADNGVNATQEFTSILGDINNSVRKVTDLIAEVSAASNEQSQGIEQVNLAISQLNQVTQQNAASSEESSSASEELAAQAQQMNGIVVQLRGVVEGSRGSHEHYDDHLNLPPRTTSVAQPISKAANRVQSSIPKKGLMKKRNLSAAPKAAGNGQNLRASEVLPFDDDVSEFK